MIIQTTRTLRIYLSNTVSGQVWQNGGEPSTTNFETGEGIPAWQFRIEGRLLEVRPHYTLLCTARPYIISPAQVANSRHRNLAPTRKFSTLVKKMVIELERDINLYPDGNIVEVSDQARLTCQVSNAVPSGHELATLMPH